MKQYRRTHCSSCQRPLLLIGCCVFGLTQLNAQPPIPIVFNEQVPEVSEHDAELQQILAQLGAAEFGSRVAGSAALQQLSNSRLEQLAKQSATFPSAEVILRLLAEVDRRYASGDAAAVASASAALEDLAVASRLMIADQASQSLKTHWQTRIELAAKELQTFGAIVRMGTFATAGENWGREDGGATLQILINKDWNGGDPGLQVFRRMLVLTGSASSGLNIYLIDGNPLTPEQKATLAEYVGKNRIAERSRAALGIKPHLSLNRGILIGVVTKGSSAEEAGLKSGDLILGILDPPNAEPPPADKSQPGNKGGEPEQTELRDFDDLVDRLKSYDRGDVMKLQVIRSAQNLSFSPDGQPKSQPEVVDVKLKGWEDMEINP